MPLSGQLALSYAIIFHLCNFQLWLPWNIIGGILRLRNADVEDKNMLFPGDDNVHNDICSTDLMQTWAAQGQVGGTPEEVSLNKGVFPRKEEGSWERLKEVGNISSGKSIESQ